MGAKEYENGNGQDLELLIDATDYLDRSGDSGIMELPDIAIGRSVGAKVANYDVKDLETGGNPDNWQHVKAIGYIDFYGEERMAEVHWFQEETVGKHKFKIKKWIDE